MTVITMVVISTSSIVAYLTGRVKGLWLLHVHVSCYHLTPSHNIAAGPLNNRMGCILMMTRINHKRDA